MTVQSPQVTCSPPVQSTTITVTDNTAATTALPQAAASTKSTTLSSVATSSFLSPCATMAAKAAGGLKVSFRDRIKALQHDSGSPTTSPSITAPTPPKDTSTSTNAPLDNHNLREKLTSPLISSKSSSKSPSTTLSIKEKLRQFSHGHLHGQGVSTLKYSEDALKPWSKLKMATVVSTGGSYSSLSSSQNEESPTDTKTSDAQPVEKLILKQVPVPEDQPTNQVPSGSDADTSRTPNLKTNKVRPFNLQRSEPKNYKSVDDLSPEYSGLPFVKKLKILNERQKLAALESVIQTRSFSLDCADSETADAELSDSLIRSYSEASGMARSKKHSIASMQVPTATDPAPTQQQNHDTQCLMGHSPLLSPESNETMERRQLKSILKRLSDEKSQDSSVDHNGQLQLMQAQTIEGYVARHSKFAKSVTFNSTLSSPPHSARSDQQAALSCVADHNKPSHFPAFHAQSPISFQPPSTKTPVDHDDHLKDYSYGVTTKHTIGTTAPMDDLTVNEVDRLVSTTPATDDHPVVAKKFIKGRIVAIKINHKNVYCKCTNKKKSNTKVHFLQCLPHPKATKHTKTTSFVL